jgi:hypothetical protein
MRTGRLLPHLGHWSCNPRNMQNENMIYYNTTYSYESSESNSNLSCLMIFSSEASIYFSLLVLISSCTSVSDLSQYLSVANRHEYQRRRNTTITKSKAALRSIFTLLSASTLGYITCAQKRGPLHYHGLSSTPFSFDESKIYTRMRRKKKISREIEFSRLTLLRTPY